ncbi:MAG: flagellar FliJ family protein [Deltaproteobacteria bacterium]|nr:flagellar FliJ family protein [Deltaproteobacteria bacterium]
MAVKTGFENILELKENLLELETAHLAAINIEIKETENSIITLKSKLNSLHPSVEKPLGHLEMEMLISGRNNLEYQIGRTEKKLENLRIEFLGQQQKVQSFHQELQGIKKVHDRKRKEMERVLQKKMEREVDDIFSTRSKEP